jgi:hypothetical protein
MSEQKSSVPVDPIADALEKLASIAESQAKQTGIIAKQNAPKSLEVFQIAQTSVFNPRGEKDHQMPRLKCDIYAPWKIDRQHHGCTREEVELFNLLEPGEYPFELNDGAAAKMQVIAHKNDATGAIEELHLLPTPPWNQEHKQRFPAMTVMLRDILGEPAEAIVTMKREKAQIARGELSVSVDG